MNRGLLGFPSGPPQWPGVVFDTTLSAPTSLIDTGDNALPPHYTTLEIIVVVRTDEVTDSSSVIMRFNNDSGTNYTRVFSGTINATASNNAETGNSGISFPTPGANNTAGTYGIWRFVIPFYGQATAHYKIVDTVGGWGDTTTSRSRVYILNGMWRSTVPIHRVSITPVTASKLLLAGTRMTIYGR